MNYRADKVLCHKKRLEALKAGAPIYPVHLQVVPTNKCNFDCPKCLYRHDSSLSLFGPSESLSFGELMQVFNDCEEMGVKAIQLTGGGEPTLHRDIDKIVTNLAARPFHIGLVTNGMCLDKLVTNGVMLDKLKDLYPVFDWIRVSVDAATAQTFARIRGGRAGDRRSFENVLTNLRNLCADRDDEGFDTTIGAGFVVERENEAELADAVLIFKLLGVDNVRVRGAIDPKDGSVYESERMRAEISAAMRVEGIDLHYTFDKLESPSHERCWYSHFTLYLGADGNVYRCCNQAYTTHGLVGSLADYSGSLKALLDDPKVQKKLAGFDARECCQCQFNAVNQVVAKAMKDDASSDAVSREPEKHDFFV
jgi:molybdenum cofactor biosynthesis enzyme MoaA